MSSPRNTKPSKIRGTLVDCRGAVIKPGDLAVYMKFDRKKRRVDVTNEIVERLTNMYVIFESGKRTIGSKCVVVTNKQKQFDERVQQLEEDKQELYNDWKKAVDMKCVAITKLSLEIEELKAMISILNALLSQTHREMVSLKAGETNDRDNKADTQQHRGVQETENSRESIQRRASQEGRDLTKTRSPKQ